MKLKNRLALLLAVLITLFSVVPSFAVAEESDGGVAATPDIISGNALVAYCVDDKQILYSNRLDERVEPTVAAKLVTCMVVADLLAEKGLNFEDVTVTVTTAAIENSGNVYDVRVPMMGFEAGDTCLVDDLLSSVLVASANDAAAALACHFGEAFLGGDLTSFVERMNQKCADLGLENTNFVNPTGISAPNQYSTPREVAMIAAAFYGYNQLVTLSDVEYFRYKDRVTIRNGNYLKNGHSISGYTNKNAIGIIAGQLDTKGNYCLIAGSQKDGKTYMFVVMCATGMKVEVIDEKTYYSFGEGNAYDDMNKLIAWTREAFTLVTLATKNTIIGELRVNLGSSADHVMIVPAVDVERLVISSETENIQMQMNYNSDRVYKTEFNGNEYDTINAPVNAGECVGTVTYSYNGNEIATVEAVVKEGVESDGVKATLNKAKNFLFGDVMKTILRVILAIIVIYIIAVIVTAILKAGKKISSLNSGKHKKSKAEKRSAAKFVENEDENTSTREMR